MSKFVRRKTVAELDIEGNLFIVDFGRDGIQGILSDTARKTDEVSKKYTEEKDEKKRWSLIEAEQKEIMKSAINDLLGEGGASDLIFAKDNTAAFIADVYVYITQEFAKTMKH